jgi:hypothetical protein
VVEIFTSAREKYGTPAALLSDIQDVFALKSPLLPAGGARIRGDRCPLHIAA